MADVSREQAETLGDYVLESVLGRGGSSVVYRARHRTTGAVVALKLLSKARPESLLRFKREFRIVTDLDHPGLVKLFELVVEDGRSYLTMEWVDGSNLDELAPGDDEDWPTVDPDALEMAVEPSTPVAPTDVAPLCRVMLAVTDALEALHLRGILHRDLKPSNVLVAPDGRVRVCDFGLACDEGDPDLCARVGTLSYMAPEQLRGESVGPAADRYALGGILFRLLTGQHPVVGDVSRATEAKSLAGGLRPSRRVDNVPPLLDTLCAELLDPSPEARPELSEIRSVLERFAQMSGPSPVAWRETGVLAGRDHEVNQLMETLRAARRGQPSLSVIAAPSGLGKSALASHLLGFAAHLGFHAFSGRCYERERVPYNGFDALVDAVATELGGWPQSRREPLAHTLHSLAVAFPVLGIALGGLGDAPIDLDDVAPALTQLLRALAESRPVLLVLDDLQWLSEESDQLLRQVVRDLAGRIAILGLTRRLEGWPAGEREPSEATQSLIALARLSDEAVRTILERVVGESLPERDAAALVESSAGSPLMAQRLAIGWSSLPELAHEAPATFGELIHHSLHSLSAAERGVLELASVAGGRVDHALLGEVAELARGHLELCLARLKAQRLLSATSSDEVDVSHDQVREVLYERLDPTRARALHRALASALAARGGADPEALLQHWSAAGESEQRRASLIAAAKRAAERHAPHRARQLLYERLAEDDAADHPTRAVWLEEASHFSERLGDYPAAIDELAEAIECLVGRGSSRSEERLLLMRARLGALYSTVSRFDIAEATFAAAFADAGLSLAKRPAGNALRVVAEQVADAVAQRVSTLRGLLERLSGTRVGPEAAIEMLSLYGAMMLPSRPGRATEALVRAVRIANELGQPHLARRYMPEEFAKLLALFPGGLGKRVEAPPPGWEGYAERQAGMALLATAPKVAARRLEKAARIYQTLEVDGKPPALVCLSSLPYAYLRAGELDNLHRIGLQLVARADHHSRNMGHFTLVTSAILRGDAAAVLTHAADSERDLTPLKDAAETLRALMRRYRTFGTGAYEALLDETLPILTPRLRLKPVWGRLELNVFALFAGARLATESRLDPRHHPRLRRLGKTFGEGEPYLRFLAELCHAIVGHAEGRPHAARRALARMRDAMPDDAADWERWYALRMASRITGLSPDDRALMSELQAAGFGMLPNPSTS